MARFDVGTPEVVEQAAQSGLPDALFELGLMHSTGRDAPVDFVAAHKWFNLAAMRGNEAARRYRMEIARDMTRAEIAEAQRRAREWLSKS